MNAHAEADVLVGAPPLTERNRNPTPIAGAASITTRRALEILGTHRLLDR